MQKKYKKKEVNLTDCYMLGVLAADEDLYPNIGEFQECVTPHKTSTSVVFYVKPLSNDPETIQELDNHLNTKTRHLYIGFDRPDNFPSNFLEVGYHLWEPSKKAEYLRERLEGKLILYKPTVKYDTKIPDLVHKNLEIIVVEDTVYTHGAAYIAVPKTDMPVNDFEEKLSSEEHVLFPNYNHFMSAPEFIICGDYLYYSKGGWKADPSQRHAWVQTMPYQVKKFKISDDFSDYVVSEVSDNLIFVDKVYLFSQEGKISHTSINPKTTSESNQDAIPPGEMYNSLEIKFLDLLVNKSIREMLCYDKNDLWNFHISVKTNDLTIISGMSGTGKTQLAITYANSLGLTQENKRLLILPISPSYTEPGDILGFLNTSSGLYNPAETGLVDFLRNAEKKPDQMHMIIFDEMNLSQVEHWFAPFMSLLEMKGDNRVLALYSKNVVCHNSERYPSAIKINSNIIFVGTVNMDETTKDFSDRLLDRANVVTLNKKSFSELKKELASNSSNELDEIPTDVWFTTEQFRGWNYNQNSWDALSDIEAEFFDELHLLLSAADSQKGVSFRILERMGRFLSNIPVNKYGAPILSRELALDLQVKQRIMTKVRGPVDQYSSLIGTLPRVDEEISASKLFDFFASKKASELSSFDLTKREIKRKAWELFLNGYAT